MQQRYEPVLVSKRCPMTLIDRASQPGRRRMTSRFTQGLLSPEVEMTGRTGKGAREMLRWSRNRPLLWEGIRHGSGVEASQ